MPSLFANRLSGFANPQDEAQLRDLDEAIRTVDLSGCGAREIREMLAVFERFPDDDGYGIFWSLVHCLEKCRGYEPLLVESAARAPTEFNLSMVSRLLNTGVTDVAGRSLLSVLEAAVTSPAASSNTQAFARSFVECQRAQSGAS